MKSIDSTHKYIVLPVNERLTKTLPVTFFANGEPVYKLDVRLDPQNPTFDAYIDISRFSGNQLSVSSNPEIDFPVRYADKLDEQALYSAEERPEVHFTTPSGWINDPNGLCEYNGEYHLFYQYNPADTVWGNMHWGHAVSKDLVHWENRPIALYPDMKGTIYSGCAVVDKDNVSGLKSGDDSPILFYYTHNIQGRTQCLAYSNDGGKTIKKYEKNPILPHMEGGNRDPKVIYCPEIEKYLMVLYLADDRYAFFTSENLLTWSSFDTLSIPGDNECPDIYRLPLDGEYYYVFKGAHSVYLIGKVSDKGFTPIEEPYSLQIDDKQSYASQSFESNSRRIDIAWHTKITAIGAKFNGQMSIPTECTLKRSGGKIRLCQYPAEELKRLYADTIEKKSVKINGMQSFSDTRNAFDLILRIPCDKGMKLNIMVHDTVIGCDTDDASLTVGKRKMPLNPEGGEAEIRIIKDRLSLEIFTGKGLSCLTHKTYHNLLFPALSLEGENISVSSIRLSHLKSIHKKT